MQLSVAVANGTVTLAVQSVAVAFTVTLLGQVMVGVWLSVIVMVVEHVEMLPCISVAVKVTTVTPIG